MSKLNEKLAKMTGMKPKNQRGFTLIEIAIVLMIIGVLAMASIYGFGVYRSSKNESEAKKINGIMSALQNKWKFDQSTATVTNATVSATNVLQNLGWVISGTAPTITILNSYNGAVSFAPATLVSTNDAFSLSLSAVPANACGDLVRNISFFAEKITVGATVVQTTAAAPAAGTAIDTACGAAATTVVALYPKSPM